jgi:O-antigen/teichoic acid export membrane protein
MVNRDSRYSRWASPVSLIRTGWRVLLSRLISNGYGQASTLLFALIASPRAVGYYSSSDKLLRAVQSSLDAFAVAILPRLARRAATDPEEFWARLRLGLWGSALLGTLAAAAVFVASPLLVSIVFGAGFEPVTSVLRVGCWLLIPGAFSAVGLSGCFYVLGDGRGVLFASLVGAVSTAVGLAVIARQPSPQGFAAAAVVTECAVALAVGLRIRRLRLRRRVTHGRERNGVS